MDIQLLQAGASDYTIIKNLVPYYVYDISEYMGWDCNDEGRWDGCDELPDYWERSDHHPYLIKVDGRVAGFVLIRPSPGEQDRREIADFFVVRKFKRFGVGKTIAFLALDTHPGRWTIRVLDGNTGARAFWTKVVDEYTGSDFILSDEQFEDANSGVWNMQFYRFDSRIS